MSPACYPSNLTDAQWELIEPLLPEPNTGGRPEKHPRRKIVNAILYVGAFPHGSGHAVGCVMRPVSGYSIFAG
ncbi:transposase, partial [Nonomuraea sp. H19]|uniref:transposase n=1 Tax=Nonomuraea sp. H19 TaxID=3452206 RepID=UPI003F8B661D